MVRPAFPVFRLRNRIPVSKGFVSDYLRARGVKLTTVDIDGRLKPDVVANLTDLPFEASSFDVVACYEVLEHLPGPHRDRVIRRCLTVLSTRNLYDVHARRVPAASPWRVPLANPAPKYSVPSAIAGNDLMKLYRCPRP